MLALSMPFHSFMFICLSCRLNLSLFHYADMLTSNLIDAHTHTHNGVWSRRVEFYRYFCSFRCCRFFSLQQKTTKSFMDGSLFGSSPMKWKNHLKRSSFSAYWCECVVVLVFPLLSFHCVLQSFWSYDKHVSATRFFELLLNDLIYGTKMQNYRNFNSSKEESAMLIFITQRANPTASVMK